LRAELARWRCAALPRRAVLALALAALLVCAWSPSARAAQEASDFVQNLGDHAISVLQDNVGSLAEREARFRALLVEGFDLDFIGRFVLGGYWKKTDADQRANYLRAFGEFIVRKYSAMLGGYAGETLTVVSEQSSGAKDILVLTRIERPSGPPLEAHWRVRIRDGSPRIIDVMVAGISMAVTQRAEFNSVIKRHGVDGLIQILDAQSDKLSATSAAN
jgi:phospholipid transport system substrate-binding protein